MHNPFRGEVQLTLDQSEQACSLLLRPTFQALAEIEQATQSSLISLARRMATGDAKLLELQAIIMATAKAASSPVPPHLPELMQAQGTLNIIEQLMPLLIATITGQSPAQDPQ